MFNVFLTVQLFCPILEKALGKILKRTSPQSNSKSSGKFFEDPKWPKKRKTLIKKASFKNIKSRKDFRVSAKSFVALSSPIFFNEMQWLLKSIRYRDKLYKKLKLTNPNSPNYDTIKTNLKTYNLILKQNIHSAKQIYYETCFHHFRNDIRNTWKTLNEILTKNKTKQKLPTVFKENGTDITGNINIANKFNTFFYKCRPENCNRYQI